MNKTYIFFADYGGLFFNDFFLAIYVSTSTFKLKENELIGEINSNPTQMGAGLISPKRSALVKQCQTKGKEL